MACCGGKDRRQGDVRKRMSFFCRIWTIVTREPKTPYGDPCAHIPPDSRFQQEGKKSSVISLVFCGG
jgi:hypothetical protein